MIAARWPRADAFAATTADHNARLVMQSPLHRTGDNKARIALALHQMVRADPSQEYVCFP